MPVDTGRNGGKRRPPAKGFLNRLARDARGNTLAIVGAALVPLTAIIGSGIDMSRAYMAKTRMQSACDAAALAARRAMQNDTLDDAVIQEGRRYFEFNFRQGLYDTAAFTPDVSRPEAGTVRVVAGTTIPTTVMQLFGFTTLPLNVNCDASLNFVNTDVMLVLDVTGSMLDPVGGVPKIDALRDAVMALYDELKPIQDQLEANQLRLRYGIVPYSSAVNVGGLLSPSHIANTATYQSRTPIYIQSQASQVHNGVTSSWCNNQGQALPTNNISFPVTERQTSYSSGNSRCTVTTLVHGRPATSNFSFWYHEARDWNTSQFKLGSSSVPLPTRTPGTNQNAAAWNGCIEERDTVSTITASSGYNIPSGATDLNINLIPNSDPTRWRPMWPEVTYRRNVGTTGSRTGTQMYAPSVLPSNIACPSQAQRLQAWSQSAMQSYVDNLAAVGGTYHDIGMIWGARMISSAGVFADSPDTYNGMPVSRHIIFMTDGMQTAYCNVYSSYGVERNSMRVSGSTNCSSDTQTNATTADLVSRHVQRFRMACNAAKGLNASIWVIAFDLALTPSLIECASNANQASTSANRDELIARFRQIGSQIGALRLTQ